MSDVKAEGKMKKRKLAEDAPESLHLPQEAVMPYYAVSI
jgi:hypothetical protein